MDFPSPRSRPATSSFLALMAGVYLGQLALAGSLSSEAAFTVIDGLHRFVYTLLNPWLHSYHLHILQNAVILGLLGWWAEGTVGSNSFTIAVILSGYTTNLAPYLVGLGGLGVGASGITNMLWAFFLASQLLGYVHAMAAEQGSKRQAMIHLGWVFVALIFVVKTVAEFVGYSPAPDNAAVGAHLVGVLLGFCWFILRHTDLTTRIPFEIQAS